MSWHIIPTTSFAAAVREGRLKAPETGAVSFETLAELEVALETMDKNELRIILHSPHPADVNPDGRDLSMIAHHLKVFKSSPALHALDRVRDGLESKESFVKTMVRMPAPEYGDLVGDAAFSDVDNMFRVYNAGYFIEELEGGQYGLLLLRDYFSTSQDGLTLEDLEGKLFDFVLEEQGLEIGLPRQVSDFTEGP